jgi:osmotically-inducible protein OsmY
MNRIVRLSAVAAAAAATLALAACNKQPESPTVGQQVDRAVAKVENAGEQAKAAATEAAGNMSAGAKDMAITTQINAALAADDRLKATQINVDTSDGKVTLNGVAPDSTSRERATALAQGVEGVVSVDNKLSVN